MTNFSKSGTIFASKLTKPVFFAKIQEPSGYRIQVQESRDQ